MAAAGHYEPSEQQQQHQRQQPLHHPTMNVETNLLEELEEYDDDDDDDEKEQHGEQEANTNTNNTNNNTVMIMMSVHCDDDEENDRPLSSSSSSPSSMPSKKRRIRERDQRKLQQQQQQQQQPSSSSACEQQPAVLMSPQQQQKPRRQRQRIVIQFDNPVVAAQEEEDEATETEAVTITPPPAAAAVPQWHQQQDAAVLATTTTDANAPHGSPLIPAAAAALSLGSQSLSKHSSSFFSTEWLTAASAPSSPIITSTSTTSTTLQQQQQEQGSQQGEEEGERSRCHHTAPASLLLADNDNDDDDGTTIPSTSVCGMGTGGNDHHENMSHGLRLLFHSESNLLSLGGGTTTTSTTDTTGNKQRGQKKEPSSSLADEEEDDDDTDDSSLQSAPYFDVSDVAPIHWAQALTEHEVMVGLAVVAITISLAHPLLFLAGSLTALGTATAVGAGYDYLTEGPIGRCLGLTTTTGTSSSSSTGVGGCHRRNSSTSIPLDETTAAATTTTRLQESVVAVQAPCETADTAVTAPVLLVHALLAHHDDKNDTTAAVAIMDPRHSATTVIPRRPATNPRYDSAATSCALMDVTANGTGGAEQVLPENWISVHYPPLEHYLFGDDSNNKNSSSSSLHTEFQGLDVLQFFNVFYSDKAPFTYMEFQKKRGDKDIVYGLWKELPPKGPLSMHPASATSTSSTGGTRSSSSNLFPLAEVDYIDYQSRVLTFKTKTNNSILGPPYATTTKEQRILLVNKKLAILEMKTTLADIPFCDRFHVLERYIIQAEKVLDQHQQPASSSNSNHDSNKSKLHNHNKNHHHYYHCRITNASCQVFFQKSCPFETQIRTRSYASIEDVTTAWCHMATQALLLAEKAKLDRQLAEHQQQQKNVVVVDENGHEGFVDEKKDDDDKNDNVSYRISNSRLTRDISQVTNGASQLSGSGGTGGGGGDDDAVLDVDSIEVMRSPSSKHGCVVVRDYSSMTGHDYHDKGGADVGSAYAEIPDVVRIPTLAAASTPDAEEERIIEKKSSTSIRNVRLWYFKFRGRASRPSSSTSSQSASTSRQQHQNDMGTLSENTST